MLLGKGIRKLKATLLTFFILFLPTQLGYHFWPPWAYVFGIRIDYLSPTVYFTDVIVVALALLWLFEKRKKLGSIRPPHFLFLLGLFALVNISTALLPQAALYKWAKIAELMVVAFIFFKDKSLDIKKTIILPLCAATMFVFIHAVIQLVLQKSLGGPLYFLGERTFTSGTPGISLYSIFGRFLLRPYSTFSHPNSMAGFVGVAFLFLVGLGQGLNKKPQTAILGSAACLGALLLSGSKAAIGGLALVLGVYVLVRERKEFFKKALAGTTTFIVLASMLSPLLSNEILRKNIIFSESFGQRLTLSGLAGELYSQKPLVGLGLNNFIPKAAGLKQTNYYPWLLQPVHNVPLLVLAETGIVGFGIFVWFLHKLVKKASRMPIIFGLTIIFVLVTASVDHYWLTLQQNQLLLAVFIGAMLRKNYKKYLLH